MFAAITLILNEVKSQQIIIRDISNNQGIINIGTQVISDSDANKPVGRPFPFGRPFVRGRSFVFGRRFVPGGHVDQNKNTLSEGN